VVPDDRPIGAKTAVDGAIDRSVAFVRAVGIDRDVDSVRAR